MHEKREKSSTGFPTNLTTVSRIQIKHHQIIP